MTEAIELRGIEKRYGAQAALAGVDLVVRPGEFTALVGGSGSGKTTLLKTINALVTPDAGEVWVQGERVGEKPPYILRRKIGYVFQEIGLFPHLTVGENVAVTPKLLGWDAARRAARADELLALVRLDRGYGARYPHELSGGERQRVGVARALAADPEIVLMDEPFSALDALTRDALGQDYRALHASLGLTSVMITHDMLEALLLADRIIVLRDGHMIADGKPAELMQRDDDPFLRELMQTPRRHAAKLNTFLSRSP